MGMPETDASEPGTVHADELFKHEYAHGTRYLGKMGRMAFAHIDIDDDGTLFHLAMAEQQFEQNRDKWEAVSADEIPDRALEAIEEKFAERKRIHEVI